MKKEKTGYKVGTMVLIFIFIVSIFAGCGDKPQENLTEDKKSLKVGLVQLVEHTSLDEIRTAFEEELLALAEEEDITLEIEYKNAQGDMGLVQSICRNFVENKVDTIVAIATPTAQGAVGVTTEIPIVFSAVTDPVAAGLLENLKEPEGNITGVSDYIDVEKIFELAEELTPAIQRYGLIYNKGEVNSVSVIEDVKEYLDRSGQEYVEKIVTQSGEVQQATRALLEECDGIFVPIDNTVASAMATLSEEAKAQKVPVYTAADSLVIDGGLATVGVNYTELGVKTAEMTLAVLQGTPISSLPVQVMEEGRPVVNAETAKAIGVSAEQYIDSK